MGTWGYRAFDNDAVLDWLEELVQSEDPTPVREAFAVVAGLEGEFLEADEAAAGVGAAEVVAALRGNPGADLPDDLMEWLAGRAECDPQLQAEAVAVVTRIRTDSELQYLWGEWEEGTLWQREMEDLLSRLRHDAGSGSG